jgi:hypothetical protein
MEDMPNIGFVDSHAKCNGSHQNFCFSSDETCLNIASDFSRHSGMKPLGP